MSVKEIKVLDKGFVRLVDVMGNDSAIVQSARVSYGEGTKSPSDDKTLIRYLLRHKHTSPFEMVEFKFHCKMPIFVARQWIRHRTANVNEISGRYSEMPNEFYVPDEKVITFQNPKNKQGGTDDVITVHNVKNPDDWWDCLAPEQIEDTWNWGEHFRDEQELIRNNYERWLGAGVRRELARINLPLSQYTEWYWKIDLHNLFHFLRLRLDSHAQYEIRVYAEAIYDIIKEICPMACKAFNDYILKEMRLSKAEIKTVIELIDLLKNCVPTDPKEGWEDILPKQIEEAVSWNISNKREQQECISKLEKLFLYHREDEE